MPRNGVVSVICLTWVEIKTVILPDIINSKGQMITMAK